MLVVPYLTAIIGSLHRLFCYIFLQVIPTRLAYPILPLLYIIYSACLFLSVRRKDHFQDQVSDKSIPDRRPHSRPRLQRLGSLWHILLCIPSSSNHVNRINFLANTLLLAAAAEFAYGPLFDDASSTIFTRVGAIYPDSVKIAVRYPFSPANNASINVLWREVHPRSHQQTHWYRGPIVNLSESEDWVSSVKLEKLWPGTTYEYILADTNQTILSYPPHPIRFSTFPDPRLTGSNIFRFAVSSCVTPNFPYQGPLYKKAIRGFDLLADHIRSSSNPAGAAYLDHEQSSPHATTPIDFLLFLGDFIYADVPIYFGDTKEMYRKLYRRNYQSPSFRKVYERLPIFHIYDDHEIMNNFVGDHNDSKPPFPNAADAYKLYNADANYDSMHDGQFYYEFRRRDVAFFVMDTRRYRSGVEGSDFSDRSMLGEQQLSALLSWLAEVNNTASFKFIATSVPFTTLWSHDAQFDSWAGFPNERQILLDAFHSVPNVIILSGDRHEFATIEFNTENPQSHSLYEISTSPLSMFYIPFIRTLSLQSQEIVTRTRKETVMTANGEEILELTEELPKETVLKYIPAGNSKWSSILVNTTNVSKPILRLETFVDGESAYNLTIEGVPLKTESSKALDFSVTDSLKTVFSKLGFASRWW